MIGMSEQGHGGVLVAGRKGDDGQLTRFRQRSKTGPFRRRGRAWGGYKAPGRRSVLQRRALSFPASLLHSACSVLQRL
jgi:hypothetical protein